MQQRWAQWDTEMVAKRRFDATMDRCNALVALATQGRGNDDCLRMAIVLAVAAMERYVKDRFLELLTPYCRIEAGTFNEALNTRLNEAGIDASFWSRRALCPQKMVLKTVRSKMAKHLESFAIQTATSIDDLFRCYGMKNLTVHAADKTGLKTMKSSLRHLIARRHDIAHSSDHSISGTLQAVDASEVSLRLNRLSRFVTEMETILLSSFTSLKKKHRSANKVTRNATKRTCHLPL